MIDISDRVQRDGGYTWHDILEQWSLVEADLQQFGVDVGDKALMEQRSWRWLQVRILGLFATESRVSRHFSRVSSVESTEENGTD